MENNQPHIPPPFHAPPPTPPPHTTQPSSLEMSDYATALLITQKKNVDEVRNALMQRGLDAESASAIITSVQADATKKRRAKARSDMMVGGSICSIGLVVTLVSLAVASSSEGGGTYFISWGAILFGGIQFFRGLSNWRK